MEFYKYVVLIVIVLIGYVAGLIVGRRQPINVGVELELQREIYELKNKLDIRNVAFQQMNELAKGYKEELDSKNYNGDAVQLKYYERLIEEKDAKIEAMRNELQRLYKEAKENNPIKLYKVGIRLKSGETMKYKFHWDKTKIEYLSEGIGKYLSGECDSITLFDDKTKLCLSKGEAKAIEFVEE